MGRTSGPFPLGTANTWPQTQTFNGSITANGFESLGGGLGLKPQHFTTSSAVGANNLPALGDATAGAITLTLNASPANGQVQYIKKIDATVNAVTISGNGHNIDGAATLVLSAQNAHTLICYDGPAGVWWVIG